MTNAVAIGEWLKVGGARANAEYEASGPDKHEIESMRSDEMYEHTVVVVVADAWDIWAEKVGATPFSELSEDEQVAATTSALNDPAMKYGSYRGRLPEQQAVLSAIRAIR